MPESPDIALNGVSKSYGSTRALVDVDLELRRGEVVAFLGENGAGKSTAAKVLCGLERPDTGTLRVAGQPLVLGGPRDAHRHGIFLIPQELAYVPELTVAENILLGWAPSRAGFTSPRSILAAAREQAARFGFDVPLKRRMKDIALADIQMVEILKALRVGARAIVLDEPTSSLTEDESARLFAAVRMLAANGACITFVSHRLDEVLEGADRVHVFRDGRVITSLRTSEATRQTLSTAMLGKPLVLGGGRRAGAAGAPGLAVTDWSSADGALGRTSVSFGAGEITVLYGLRGSGSDALAEGLAGARAMSGASVTVGERRLKRPVHPKAALRAGIAYVPPDRHRQGLMMHLSVEENLVLHCRWGLARHGLRRVRREAELADRAVREYRIRVASIKQNVGELSGGNQQKVLLASRLNVRPRVLVLQEPSRGVDVGAREEIHRTLREYAQTGGTVIVATADFEEALQLADRMVVFRRGQLVGDLRADAMSDALDLAKGAAA